MSDDPAWVATPSQTVGPFLHLGLKPHLSQATGGDRIRLLIVVTDGDGQPVDDALIEVWPAAGDPGPGAAFARQPTGRDGGCEFELVRPAHLNVCLFARGLLRQLHTRIYFAADEAVEPDAVLALVPEPRRSTLLAYPDPDLSERWRFNLRLQGPEETVFFDI